MVSTHAAADDTASGDGEEGAVGAVAPVSGEVSGADAALVDDTVLWLNAAVTRSGLDLAVAVRAYILDRFFEGSFGAFADPHRQKPQSFIALTRREDLELSHASIYALVRVGQQLEELTPTVAQALTVKHHRALLPLSDTKAKSSLAKKAVTQRWTATQLEDAVRAQLPATRRGRTPLPPVVKEVRALRRAIAADSVPLDAVGDLSGDQRQELQDALADLEARLTAIRAALEGAVS